MSYQLDRIKGIPAPLPADYDRQANFTNWEVQNPGEPPRGVDLDAEFNAVEQAVDETQARLRLIQRDDGALANGSVGLDQFSDDALIGLQPPTNWQPFTNYQRGNTVIYLAGSWYYADQSHVSSNDFNADHAAGRWVLLLDIRQYTQQAELAAQQAFAAQVAAQTARNAAQQAQAGAEVAEANADARATSASQSVTQVQTLTDGVLEAQAQIAFLQGLPLGTSFIDENGDLNFYVYDPAVQVTILPNGELVFAKIDVDDPFNLLMWSDTVVLGGETLWGFDGFTDTGFLFTTFGQSPSYLTYIEGAPANRTVLGFNPAPSSSELTLTLTLPNATQTPVRFLLTSPTVGEYTAVDGAGNPLTTDVLGLKANVGSFVQINVEEV